MIVHHRERFFARFLQKSTSRIFGEHCFVTLLCVCGPNVSETVHPLPRIASSVPRVAILLNLAQYEFDRAVLQD